MIREAHGTVTFFRGLCKSLYCDHLKRQTCFNWHRSRLKRREQILEAETKVHAYKHLRFPRVKQRSETDVQSNYWMIPSVVAFQHFFVFLVRSDYANRTCFEGNTGLSVFLLVSQPLFFHLKSLYCSAVLTTEVVYLRILKEHSEFGGQIYCLLVQLLMIIFS